MNPRRLPRRLPKGRLDRTAQRQRGDLGQQAIVLVLAILTLMSALAVIVMTQTAQETPIVNRTLLDHSASQALHAGINDYLYAINADPNAVACSSGSPASCLSFIQAGFTFGSWNLVSTNPAPNAVHQWFAFGSPKLTQGTPPPNATPGTVAVTLVGAAGYLVNLKSIVYQTARVIVDPQNGLLLNVIWDNYEAPDPSIPGLGNGATCRYSYIRGTDPCNPNGGSAVFSGPAFSVFGPLFSNDNVFVCGTPTIEYLTSGLPPADYNGPGSNYGAFAAPGCTNSVQWGGAASATCQFCVDRGSPERAPTSDANLAALAKLDGCYYSGPTTITFTGNGYDVSSPETTATGANPTFDPYSAPRNQSVCFPSDASNNGSVGALPQNGVIYVAAPPSTCGNGHGINVPSTNPLYAYYQPGTKSTYDGETRTPQCEGDAIVHGTVIGDVTVGVANDIIIDGNITYGSNGSSSCAPQSPVVNASGQWNSPCAAVSGQLNDVLGLVANNYVELGLPLPLKRHTAPSPPGTCASGIGCQLKNPIIEAAILTLDHTFGVTNVAQTSGGHQLAPPTTALGKIDFLGSLAENYSDIEQVGSVGYGMNYNWDARLSVLSPPSFLTPLGSNAWALQATSVAAGTCSLRWPVNPATCPTSPFPSS